MSLGDYFLLAVRAGIFLFAATMLIKQVAFVARAPKGERKYRLLHETEGRQLTPLITSVILIALMYMAAFEIGQSAGCMVDWDGRSNPTVCE